MNTLPSSISMGSVMLRVADLDSMTRYYSNVLGLKVIGEDQSSRVLGGDKGSALVLISAPELKHASPSDAGLFHTAFLYSSRSALATAVASIARSYPESFTGSADHIVSEAFYFDDPEGNGVELYFDRERTGWSWQHGQIMMDTLYLDPNKYLAEHLSDPLIYEYPAIGHVHLSVGNISLAKEFYVDALGFEVTLNWGGTALFVSAGGYHHHMAMNIWRSRGAGKRQQTLGLGDVSIVLPDSESYGETLERLGHFGLKPRGEEENKVSFDDPWGNQVSLLRGASPS
jgi:catechol 2,3-dioxygenase